PSGEPSSTTRTSASGTQLCSASRVCGSESILLYVGITTSVLIGVVLTERIGAADEPAGERTGPTTRPSGRPQGRCLMVAVVGPRPVGRLSENYPRSRRLATGCSGTQSAAEAPVAARCPRSQ